MNSPLPKVLHPVAGLPMVYRTVQCLQTAGTDEIRVVVGFGESLVRQVLEPLGAVCFSQQQQRGTADAVRAARPENLKGPVLILNGDHPLITTTDITAIMKSYHDSGCDIAVVTCQVDDPGMFGRIVRHGGKLRAIVEAKDAGHETLKIQEVNTGIYVVDAEVLSELLPKIKPSNKQGEYYLTDIIALGLEQGHEVEGFQVHPRVGMGVNTQKELAMASEQLFKQNCDLHLQNGVIVISPQNTFIEEGVEIASGAVIFPGCYIKGRTKIGSLCVIEPNCYIDSCLIEANSRVKAGCYLTQAKIAEHCEIGPYAHLRPDTEISSECRVGNFVEMKKVKFGKGSKAAHLSYLGDAVIGQNVNIGCGTITCNYAADRKKYVTRIEDNVFVGSDSQFVAPVTVGQGAYIGSGSTITKDVPAGALAVTRATQVVRENYQPKGLKANSEE